MGGILSLGAGVGPETPALLDRMGDALAHGGPDDAQTHVEDRVGFVHRRLALVDVLGGRQPIVSADGALVAMVSGAITNHRELRERLRRHHAFQTGSDAEVLLPLYREHGLELVHHLMGTYAIALWDRPRQRLVLVRDRLGLEPLAWARLDGLLVFASEVKALFTLPTCPRELDGEAAITEALGRPPAAVASYFSGIVNVAPGSIVEADLRTGVVRGAVYWTLPDPDDAREDPRDDRNETDVVTGFREILEDAVTKSLVADVETGLFLGAGVDSIAIASLAARRHPLHTFSLRGPGSRAEPSPGRRAAQELGLPNHEVCFDPLAPLTPDAYASVLWACETPWTGPEQICRYHLHRYARAERPALKVVLLGYDELVADARVDEDEGADGDGFDRALRAAERASLLDRLRPGLFALAPRDPRHLRSRAWLAAFADERVQRHAWSALPEAGRAALPLHPCCAADRTAAAHGLLARLPFLDHRLVDFAFRLPPRLRRPLLDDRSLLRRACAPLVPPGIAARRHGLAPRVAAGAIRRLLEAHGGALVEEAFAGAAADREAARRVLRSHELEEDPAIAEDLLHLVNVGLLARLARETPHRRVDPAAVELLVSIPAPPWESVDERLAGGLEGGLERGPIALRMPAPLAFGPDVVLLRPADGHDGRLFLMVRGVIRTELVDGAFAQVLLRIDGTRSLAEILRGLGMPESEIRRPLEEALDEGLVRFVAPASSAPRRHLTTPPEPPSTPWPTRPAPVSVVAERR